MAGAAARKQAAMEGDVRTQQPQPGFAVEGARYVICVPEAQPAGILLNTITPWTQKHTPCLKPVFSQVSLSFHSTSEACLFSHK